MRSGKPPKQAGLDVERDWSAGAESGDDRRYRSPGAIERSVTSNGRPLRILVTGNLDDSLRLVDDFRGQTLIVLTAVGIALAIMSGIVARLALRPVGRLSTAIEQVREGEAQSITGTYPREIAPLAEEINELLRSNTQIIERARNAVGNLAHGLKTPLAVMRNEAAAAKDDPLAKVVAGESEKMTQLVTTYLDRARIAARSAVVGKKADATMVTATTPPLHLQALSSRLPAISSRSLSSPRNQGSDASGRLKAIVTCLLSFSITRTRRSITIVASAFLPTTALRAAIRARSR